MLSKSKKVMGRTALYLPMSELENLEKLAKDRDMSLNMFALSLIGFGLSELEKEKPKKKRVAK